MKSSRMSTDTDIHVGYCRECGLESKYTYVYPQMLVISPLWLSTLSLARFETDILYGSHNNTHVNVSIHNFR